MDLLSVKKSIKNYFKNFMSGASFYDVYVGNYKYSECDGCKYRIIVGNADFSECGDLNLKNLEYVSGIVNVSDSFNLNFGLKTIGQGLIMSNNHNLKFPELEEIKGDCIISDTFIDDISKVRKIGGKFCFNNSKVFKCNPYVNEKIDDELFFEK